MRLAGAFTRLIAVESQTVERAPAAPVTPSPAPGARWGRPASFEIPSRPRATDKPATLTYQWVDKARLFRGVESHREYRHATTAIDGTTLGPEAIRSVTFFLGSRAVRRERREAEGGVTNVTPVIETIRDYVKLTFPFGDPEGARGTPHPPPTPPRAEPGFD